MEEKDIKRISKNSPMAQIELIKSDSFKCISVNEMRVTDGKLYGYGRTVACCHVNKDRLKELIKGKETVEVCAVDSGRKGIWIDGIKISQKGKKADYEEYLKRLTELRKKCSKKYRPQLLLELRELDYWKVKTENIQEALNYSYNFEKNI